MKDRDFLIWLHKRLEHRYEENPNMDYMSKLRSIIMSIDPEKQTPNTGPRLPSDFKLGSCALGFKMEPQHEP